MSEQRKQLMKKLVRVLFVIAWFPIVWLLLSATLGKALVAFMGIAWLAQVVITALSLWLILLAFRHFSR